MIRLVVVFGVLVLCGCRREAVDVTPVELSFAGRRSCAECHATQHEAWAGSHHDLAMQVADETTVLGDFDDATFTHNGVTSTFFRREGAYMVRTEGPDGAPADYEIAYTFGVTPLQQYLVAFPGGRYQVLTVCWDSRPAADGGQRWFHLYPDEVIPHDDVLHWTGRNLNWNFMCAECHSTDLRKNYDLEQDHYRTTWAEIDVSCEACHGPGSRHIAWARGEAADPDGTMGLAVAFKIRDDPGWTFEGDSPTASRDPGLRSDTEIETCARCHARRAQISDRYVHGGPLLDTHLVRRIEDGLYHPDGQILDEVYVYGSFLQSRMYKAGVRCSDCHDPHSLELHAPGDTTCTKCHQRDVFGASSHHHHEPGSPGSQCVECHMPARTYMVVDPRRDHSFRVPRPDLSVTLGTPNACNRCHADKGAPWAADAVATWYGPDRRTEPHFGETLHAAWAGSPGAERALVKLADDAEAPPIVRASAIALLYDRPGPATRAAVETALRDPDPLVRLAAVEVLDVFEPRERTTLAAPFLEDPVRTIRLAAARVLAPLAGSLNEADRAAFSMAAAEVVESELTNAGRPQAHINLGNFFGQLGMHDKAAAAYRQALRLDERSVQAYVNWADIERARGRDDECERLLYKALDIDDDLAAAHHALGLVFTRQDRMQEALSAFGRAAALEPDNARFAYVYAVALGSVGMTAESLWALENAHDRHPGDRDILFALVTTHRDTGSRREALRFARKLAALLPDDPAVHELLRELETSP